MRDQFIAKFQAKRRHLSETASQILRPPAAYRQLFSQANSRPWRQPRSVPGSPRIPIRGDSGPQGTDSIRTHIGLTHEDALKSAEHGYGRPRSRTITCAALQSS